MFHQFKQHLPEDLQGLTLRQAVVLHDETRHQDVDGLVRSLRGEPTEPGKRSRRWLALGTATVALLAVGAAAWWRWGPGTGAQAFSAGSNTAIAACASPQSSGRGPIALSKDPTAKEKQPDGSLIFKVKDAYWRAEGGKWQVILATSMQNATPQTVYYEDWRYHIWWSPDGNSHRLASPGTPTPWTRGRSATRLSVSRSGASRPDLSNSGLKIEAQCHPSHSRTRSVLKARGPTIDVLIVPEWAGLDAERHGRVRGLRRGPAAHVASATVVLVSDGP
jgi:hypothetical protein